MSGGYRWHQLVFPPALDGEAVTNFMRALSVRPRRGLLMGSQPVAFEVEGSGGRLLWRLGLPEREVAGLLRLLHAQLPDVRHELLDEVQRQVDRGWELRTTSHHRPLRSDMSGLNSATLLGALLAGRSGETAMLQVLVGPWLPRRPVQVGKQGQRGAQPAWSGRDWLVTSEQASALRTKYKEAVFGVVVRVGVRAPSPGRVATLRQGVIGALQLSRMPGNGLERRLVPARWAGTRLLNLQAPAIAWPCTLSASELSGLVGWPVGGPVLPGVTFAGGRQLPAPRAALFSPDVAARRHLRVTGEATYPGQSGVLAQSMRDALTHTWLAGPTGSGKSTVLAALALADVHAGRGVVLVDMKGDLAIDVADRIPAHRLGDTVLLEPGADVPVGINVLAGGGTELVVDTVLHVFEELYASSWGPRTADVMTNALTTLVVHGGLTLVELPVLLTNSQFRRKVLQRVGRDDLGVGPFWAAYEQWSEAERAQVIGPSLNKLRALTNRESTRRIIGQVNGVNLRSVFTERKVLLVSLAKGRIGQENARLLGSLLVGNLWSQVLGRSTIPADKRHAVGVYLDEFQETLRVGGDIADALAQARGLGAALTMAHQHLGQLTPGVQAALVHNARSVICFGLGAEDAKAMARVLGGGLTPEDLQGLGRYETYQALAVGGVTAAPASARTLPMPPSLGTLGRVRRLSAERYGMDGKAVDELLRERRRAGGVEAPVGERKRQGGQS